MISKTVGNISWVIFTTIIMVSFVDAIIASGIWLSTSGESLIIALIHTYVNKKRVLNHEDFVIDVKVEEDYAA